LHIGDSSLWISNALQPGTSNLIQSNDPAISFGRNNGLIDYSQISIGIGIQSPQHKLQLNDRSISLQPVYASFTNTDWLSPVPNGTGAAAIAQLKQKVETLV